MELVDALLLALAAAPDMPVPAEPTVELGNMAEVDPALVQRLLIDYGYGASLDASDPDDIIIEGRLDDTIFVVIFYGCVHGTSCTGLEFATGYDFPNGFDAEHLNIWNRDVRFGAAYLDEHKDPVLTMDVNLAADGIGPENFADWLGLWHFLVEDFEAHLDDAPLPPDGPDLIEPSSKGRIYEIALKGPTHASHSYDFCNIRGACH